MILIFVRDYKPETTGLIYNNVLHFIGLSYVFM